MVKKDKKEKRERERETNCATLNNQHRVVLSACSQTTVSYGVSKWIETNGIRKNHQKLQVMTILFLSFVWFQKTKVIFFDFSTDRNRFAKLSQLVARLTQTVSSINNRNQKQRKIVADNDENTALLERFDNLEQKLEELLSKLQQGGLTISSSSSSSTNSNSSSATMTLPSRTPAPAPPPPPPPKKPAVVAVKKAAFVVSEDQVRFMKICAA